MIIGRRIGFLRGFSTKVNLYTGNWPENFVALNNLHDNPGATKERRRVGRGEGSGRGKTCGRGHKGQNARSGTKHRLLFIGKCLITFEPIKLAAFRWADSIKQGGEEKGIPQSEQS